MSSQPPLDFGKTLAPSLSEGADPREYMPARVHSPHEAIPGAGRYVVTCQRCGRTRRRRRQSVYCSDACRFTHRHEEQGRIEAGKKKRAMRGSAALNADYLRISRAEAHVILARDGDSDADRVRLSLESKGICLPWTSGWPGSIYPGDPDHDWVTVRRAKSTHKGGKCREIRVWV